MERRAYLKAFGGTLPFLAGCIGGDGSDIKDSDGDGVIDSQDYAPNDPDVQEKSDLAGTTAQGGTPTPTPSPTPSPTLTPTPPPTPTPSPTPTASPTPTPRQAANSLQVNDEYWVGGSRVDSYNLDTVSVTIEDDFDLDFDSYQVWVGLYEFPWGEVVGEGTAGNFTRNDLPIELSVPIEPYDGAISANKRLHHLLFVTRGDKDMSEISNSDFDKRFETDPFIRKSGSREIERKPPDYDLPSVSLEGFSRENIEGAYAISVNGRTLGKNWTASLYIYKSAYILGINRSRGRSRPEYVDYELTQGFAPLLAEILDDIAEDIQFIDKREKVEFVIDFVQRLPYVTDDVSKGFDDYTKFIVETMAEGNGDCEDTSIMLASILETETFFYDMVLIEPPGHMAAGIWGDDLEGGYYEYNGRKYFYIETTGEGWGIGDIPDEYRGVEAYIYEI